MNRNNKDWQKFKDTFGQRQNTVLAEIRRARGSIADIASRLHWPIGLVASFVQRLRTAGLLRETPDDTLESVEKPIGGGIPL